MAYRKMFYTDYPKNGRVYVIDPKHQIFNGNVYGRKADGYYKRCVKGKEHKLHVDVYEFHCGKVPEGYVVHHEYRNFDGSFDKDANNIECLRLMTRAEHTAYHVKNPVLVEKICAWCGKPFMTVSPSEKYCSDECRRAVANYKRTQPKCDQEPTARIYYDEHNFEQKHWQNDGIRTLFCHELDVKIRYLSIDGKMWFVGRDVCRALGYKSTVSALKAHVELKDKKKVDLIALAQRESHSDATFKPASLTTIITLPGLLNLISKSQLPAAKVFKRWIFHDVLPKIFKMSMFLPMEPPPALEPPALEPPTLDQPAQLTLDIIDDQSKV